MSKLARRFLNLLFAFGVYKRHYKSVYNGDITSANKIWESKHWAIRSSTKNKFTKIFQVLLLEAKVKPLQEMSMFVFFNTRHDVDNLSAIQKIMADTLKGHYIPDDNTKHYKSTHTIFDSTLPKGTVEFHIIGN